MKSHIAHALILVSLLAPYLRFAQADVAATSVWKLIISEPLTAGSIQFSSFTFATGEDVGEAVITVTRTGGSDGAVTVDYATGNGTAVSPADYSTTFGTLSFSNGQTSKSFLVPIVDDYTDELNETVNLTLSNPTGGEIGRAHV
jgi:hypothetical protein